MLQIDVRDLRRGPVATDGKLEPRDQLFEGLGINLLSPVTVGGVLESAGHGGYFWHGNFAGKVQSVCRRCLEEFVTPIERSVEVIFSADPDLQDDPSVYPLVEPLAQVDLRPALREELALAVDVFPLCREDCRGLCPRCGADLNSGPCQCGTESA
jgi:uncharacterized protein